MVKSFLLPEENAAATVFLENDFLLLISSIHCLHVKFVLLFGLEKSGCNHFDYGLTCYNSMHWRKSTRALLRNATEGKPRFHLTRAKAAIALRQTERNPDNISVHSIDACVICSISLPAARHMTMRQKWEPFVLRRMISCLS
jgi:hypothetical protein